MHATATPDKIEQYLGSASTTTTMDSSSLALMPATGADRVEIGIGTSDTGNNVGESVYERDNDGVTRMDQGEGQAQTDPTNLRGGENRDAITTESVWRPY